MCVCVCVYTYIEGIYCVRKLLWMAVKENKMSCILLCSWNRASSCPRIERIRHAAWRLQYSKDLHTVCHEPLKC